MERALDLDLITGALGNDRPNLPSAEELQMMMADLEVQLFLRSAQIGDGLLDAAWYLHAVASVASARERFTPERQRQAFVVSAHIFDLALNQDNWSRSERLSMAFAAAIGYRRGGRDPNATAIMNRFRDDILTGTPLWAHLDTIAVEVGLALLGFETRALFAWFNSWRSQFASLASDSQLTDLSHTVFGPPHLTFLGADDLLSYFARGDQRRLQRGIERLRRVAVGEVGHDALDARWVAAHLLNLADEAQAGSLWNPSILPPSVPPSVRQAFTLGRPPVLTLWEPQRDLLTGDPSPFDPSVRRVVLAVPTSGGKTLVGQLISVEHLERSRQSVCYVVPTRSLGREVRRAIADRLRMLNREARPEPPDFPSLDDLLDSLGAQEEPDVEVMTPERLAHLLRHDALGVLERFGLFIFDEAQLIKESGRGFILESTISLLDTLTKQTSHKIVLISAAMGNAGAIAQWLSPDGESLRYESKWRGPRRLHAVFTTAAHWPTTTVEVNTNARKFPYRLVTELSGVIRLRMASGRTTKLYMENTGWKLVRKSTKPSPNQQGLERDQTRSTAQYRIASEMITALGHAGSVLVVANTRGLAQRLARGIAELTDEQPALTPLVEFVRLQLGESHPLVPLLQRGVGFHHAGLPLEVLEALENAVRDEMLPYLTCTSTLTEGVNLPVRTVVIYDQHYEGQPADVRLQGARLVNAIGRAGRAGRETEGWIVLVRAAEPSDQDFRDLDPDADQLAVTSTMISEAALEACAQFERRETAKADDIFDELDPSIDSFASFVWLFLGIREDLGSDPASVSVDSIVDSTLAAAQSLDARRRLLAVASAVQRKYVATNPGARQRWRRTGTSLATAATLDRLAGNLAQQLIELSAAGRLGGLDEPQEVARLLALFIDHLHQLREAPEWKFRVSPRGAEIEVRASEILAGWLGGASLQQLADGSLSEASEPDWRIEQMVDAVTSHFEHYLAWTLGALVELTNSHLSESGSDLLICPDLGGYVRYGVGKPAALVLMRSGVRSRRLANAVATALPGGDEPHADDLRAWLGGLSVSDWRVQFDSTAPELLDLLDFTRERSRSLLKDLLEQGRINVRLPGLRTPPFGPITLETKKGEPTPAPLIVYASGTEIATVPPPHQADLQAILATGIEIELAIEPHDTEPLLVITTVTDRDTPT